MRGVTLAITIVLALVALSLGFGIGYIIFIDSGDDSIELDSLNQEKQQIQSQINNINSQISALQNAINKLESEIQALENQIAELQAELDVLKNIPTPLPPPPLPICGNGVIESGESCDDGNTINEDGCDSTCNIEEAPPSDEYEVGNLGVGQPTAGDRAPHYDPLPTPQGDTRTVSSGGSLGSVSAGDIVIFEDGSYSGFSIGSSGTASNPIHIKSKNPLGAKISGSISISGNYIIFEGFDIDASSTVISLSGNNNVIIGNKLVNDAASQGIALSGDNNQIVRNHIGPVGSPSSGVGNGIAVSSSTGNLVEDNYFVDVGRSGLFLYPEVNGIEVRRNRFHRSTYTYGHGLYVQGRTNAKVMLEYNEFICDIFNACLSFRTSGEVRGNSFIRQETHGSARGLTSWGSGSFTGAKVIVENNVVYENYGSAFRLTGNLGGWDMEVLNNIFIGGENGAEIGGGGDTITLYNNVFGVFSGCPNCGTAFTGSSFSRSGSNNLYYNDGGGSIGTQLGESLTGNPGFPDEITELDQFILSGSGAEILKDAGSSEGSDLDFWGMPRTGTKDIGAFEY
jgi:cysteine-rich repeat protein